MTRPFRRSCVAAGALAFALLVGACGGGGPTPSKANLCKKLKDNEAKDIGKELSDAKSVDTLKSKLSELNDKIQKLPGVAPDDIRDDAKTSADGFQKLVDATEESTSSTDFRKRVAAEAKSLTDFEAASSRIAAWRKKNCK